MALSYKNDPQSDERLNPYELGKREQAAGSDGALGISEKKDGPSYADDNIVNAKDREKTPDNPYNYSMSKDGGGSSAPRTTSEKIKFFAKKAGPAGGITGGVIGGFAIISMLFSGAGGLLVAIKEVVTNYGSSASRAAPGRFEESLYYRLGGGGDIAQSCRGAIAGVKCRRATIKDTVVEKLRAEGFRVESTRVSGRHIVQSISRDGVRVNNSRASLRAAMQNPEFASAMNRAINPKNLVFFGDRWRVKVLDKLKLNRSKVELTGDTDEERRSSINTETGADVSDSEHESRLRADIDERSEPTKSRYRGIKGRITGAVTGAGSIACLAYNLSRVFVASTKVYNAQRYASFAFLFLKVADQIKNDGDVDPVTVAALGAVLTTPNARGLSATDAQGYKVAAYGGERKLESWTKSKLLGGSTALTKVDGTIDVVNEKVGKDNVRGACKGLTNVFVGIGINAVLCATAGGGSGAALLTTVFPGLGTALGGVAGTALCTVFGAALGLLAGEVMLKLIDWLLPIAINSAKDAAIDVNEIDGEDAGNALGLGAGVLMEGTNRSRGLQPGTKESVEQFNASTSESEQQQEAIARYDARDEPFNINNEYSFLGSLMRKTGLIYKPSLPQQLMATSSILVGSPLKVLSTEASASATMPVNVTREDLEHCPDSTLTTIGIDCDLVGGTQYVMRTNIPVEENLNFMIGTHVDDEGEPISDDYKSWIKNCTDERNDPFGVTSTPIEEETDWDTGKACVYGGTIISQTTRDHFSTFYYDEAALEDEEYEPTENVALSSSELNIATFNILHIGKGGANWRSRLTKSFNTMKENQITVAGLQEVRQGQNAAIQKQYSDTYDIWPKNTGRGDGFSPNPVIWDKAKYKKVDSGTKLLPIKYDYGGVVRHLVQVELEDSTGNSFYVLSTHDPANVRNGDPAVLTKSRYDNTKQYVKYTNDLAKTGKPVFLMGDFNSPYSGRNERQYQNNTNNRAYCVISRGGTMVNVWDVKDNLKFVRTSSIKDFQCPRPGKTPGSAAIDHIYTNYTGASDSVKINKVWAVHGGKNKIGSDHPMVATAITLPWSTQEASSGDGPAWPLDKKFYSQNKSDWLDAHGLSSGSWTNGVNGLAVDISSPPDGSQVYAMYGGKVTRSDLGGHGLIITTDIQGGKLEIAYAHGPRENKASAYNAGDKIMKLGNLGNSTGGHLHIDMSFNGKGVCPQDVFLAMAKGREPNFKTLVGMGRAPCGRI